MACSRRQELPERHGIEAASVILPERQRLAMTATKPLPPMAAGSAETFGVTVRSLVEPRDVMNEPAEHQTTVFRVSLGVEYVLVPDVVQILGGWDELFARMEIKERQVFAISSISRSAYRAAHPFFWINRSRIVERSRF